MRFLRLDLLAFGHFTDATIDLSAGNHGLHIIFGPNEAGKSSSLRALTDFLYGIPGRTNDSFLHPYGKMRIGGAIESSDGKQLQCIRRKGNQGTLRDSNDLGVVPESELTSLIGEIDRELFCTMFGIDHAMLRRGGDELVKGAGQLGASLFSSASGLGGLRELQISFSDDMERLFKSSGRSGSLVDSINEYKSKKEQQKEAQVSVDTYNKHNQLKQDAEVSLKTLDDQIYAMQVEKGRWERIGHSLPLIARWRSANAMLEKIGEVALLPEDFAISSSKLVSQLQKTEGEKNITEREIKSIDFQLQQLPLSGNILSLAPRIEEVTVRMGEYLKGKSDTGRNENYCQQNEREARNILRNMGRSDDLSKVEDELRIPKNKMLHIQSLGNKYEGLVARVNSSSGELARLRRQIAQYEQKLSETTTPPTVLALRAKVSQIQLHGDLEAKSSQLRDEIQRLASLFQGDLKRLPLWEGTADGLAALAIPSSETIARFDDEWTHCDSEIKALRKVKSDAEKQLRSLEDELERLESNQTIPTEAELAEKRATRNFGWSLIRKEWLIGSVDEASSKAFLAKFSSADHLSDAFEESVKDADKVSDQLRSDADHVASKSRLLVGLRQKNNEISNAEVELQNALDAKIDVERRWTELWQHLGIQPLSPREMRSWLMSYSQIVERVSKLNSLREDLDTNELKIKSCKADLIEELNTVGISIPTSPRSLNEILQIAEQTEKGFQLNEKNRQHYADSIAQGITEVEGVKYTQEQANSALLKWKKEWEIEMQRIGLEPSALPDEANAVLSSVTDLFKALHEADGFRKRNEGIERDARRFISDLEAVAKEVGFDAKLMSVEQVVARLKFVLDEAKESEAIRKKLIDQHDLATEQLRTANKSYQELKLQVDELCRLAGCCNPEDLPQAAELSRQSRELTRSLTLLTEQIMKFAGNKSFEDFLVEVDTEVESPDSVLPLIDRLTNKILQANLLRDKELQAIERETIALDALDRNTDVSELATECESISATIEERLRDLAVLRVCSLVLASGVERFREKNQDPMLTSAAAHFTAMTCGSFSGLRADLDEQGKAILVGIRASTGETVQISQMSDGTCDQLYLALRLASIEVWLQKHEPLPLVVDDILINFDNERALATLKRLVVLSRKIQVIFFTHHIHLIDLVRQNLCDGEVFIHNLPCN